MIAAQLRGRVHLKSKEFANQQHILVFSHILGVLDLLRPHIFRQDKVCGLLVICHTTDSVSPCYLARFHTMPEEFKNAGLFLRRLGLPSTLIHHGNAAFQKRSFNRRNLKTPALRFNVDRKHSRTMTSKLS